MGLGQGSQAELVPSDPGELSQVSEGAGSQAWEVPCQLLPPLPYPARNPYLWRCLPDPPLHIPWSSTFKRIDLPVQDRPVPCSLSAFIKGYRSAISPLGEAVRDSQQLQTVSPTGTESSALGEGYKPWVFALCLTKAVCLTQLFTSYLTYQDPSSLCMRHLSLSHLFPGPVAQLVLSELALVLATR